MHFLNINSNSDLLYISLIYNYFNSLTRFYSFLRVDYKDLMVFSCLCRADYKVDPNNYY